MKNYDLEKNTSMLVRILGTLVLCLFIGGCILSSSKVTVNKFSQEPMGERKIAISETPYLGQMTNALMKNGFVITPVPTQKQLSALQNGNSDGTITRWIVSVQTKRHGSYECVTTNSNFLHVTLFVKDLKDNQIVMSLHQLGSDGPCATVKPVFPTLVAELSKNWN